MYFFQFVTCFEAASQTIFVTLVYSVLIMHLLGMQDDLQQASGGQIDGRLLMFFSKELL